MPHKTQSKKKNKKQGAQKTFWKQIEAFFENYEIYLFIASIIIFIILGIKLFQVQVSLGEDDSAYILAAKRFLEGKKFPMWHGSFYPIFLSLFMKIIAGINLTFFRFISFILTIGQLIILYFAFRRRIPSFILILSLFFLSVNLFIITYASTTYSEPLYMFLQAVVIWSFLSLYDKIQTQTPIKKQIWDWLVLGLFLFLLSIARNIGWSGIIAVVAFFIINKQWKESLFSLASTAIFYIPYNFYKSIVWNIHQAGFEGQFRAMFLKNPYIPSLGYETLDGFIKRFIINSEQYLSLHLINMLGGKTQHINAFITIIIYLAFFFTLFVIWKKRKQLLFPIFYVGVGIAVTFISQQIFWNQERLILIYLPLIVILFSTALYDAFNSHKGRSISFIFLLAITIFSFNKTVKYSKLYTPVKQKIVQGNKYYGLTPDWQHYLQAIEYAGKNLPKDAVIACRKPGIAFLYGGGREFFGIYRFPNINVDTLIKQLQNEAYLANYQIITILIPKDSKKINNFYYLYPYFQYLRAFINNYTTQKIFAIFIVDSLNYMRIQQVAKDKELTYYKTVSELKNNIIVKNKSDYGVYPDSLMKFFLDKNINYLILGRLRKIPNNKRAGIITTVQRYINFIELKYPGTFSVIQTFGLDNDEPAYILKINYNRHLPLINQIKKAEK